jgi:hypothetical protein
MDIKETLKKIKDWQPENCKKETDFKKSLYDYLHIQFPNKQITNEPGYYRIKADITIDENFIIELKYNLKTIPKLTNLKGQIVNYQKLKGIIIIVLCGETEANIKKDIEKHINELNSNEPLYRLELDCFQ